MKVFVKNCSNNYNPRDNSSTMIATIGFANDDNIPITFSHWGKITYHIDLNSPDQLWEIKNFEYGCESHKISFWTSKNIDKLCRKHIRINMKGRKMHSNNIKAGLKYAKDYLKFINNGG